MGKNTSRRASMQPQVLDSKDIKGLASYIKSGECKRIVMMLGAGVSTSAGIPDFRSPKTGLYSNLARLDLPYPEAVFEINFFRRNPIPFYTLAQELYPGKFRPTLAHSFVKLLHDKDLLLKCFTQNIDTLERRAGVPAEKIIEAHGSFATQRCVDCHAPYDGDLIKVHILEKTIPRCEGCRGLVKPDIVFFGEELPPAFIKSISLLNQTDLLLVMGTSLTVHPFAMLAELPDDDCPRVLINLDLVGDFGSRTDDVTLLGKCDEMVRELCKELGWEDELMALWAATKESVEIEEESATKTEVEGETTTIADDRTVDEDERVENEVEALTSAIERSLALSPEDKVDANIKLQSEPEGEVLKIPEKKSTTDKINNEAGNVSNENENGDKQGKL